MIERGETRVWIEQLQGGNVRISGQTLRGGSEYEYFITIEPKDFDTIRQNLGGAATDGGIDLIKVHRERAFSVGETIWLASFGIEYAIANDFDSDFFSGTPSWG